MVLNFKKSSKVIIFMRTTRIKSKQEEAISVLQLTDTHLFADEHGTLLGIKTSESFKAVIESIVNQGMHFDFIMVSGDISQDYSPESYQRFAHMVALLKSHVFFCPGNHDDGPLMYRMFDRLGVDTNKHVICNNWQFVFLNSEVYAMAHGWVQKDELQFLRKCLERYPDLNTVVVVHHLPLLVKSRWLDTQTMHNQDEFNSFVSKFPQIKAVVCGHVHQEFDSVINNIRYIATPSTSIQFEPFSHDFALDQKGPGWRYLTLTAQGEIHTEVFRLPPGRFVADHGVSGY